MIKVKTPLSPLESSIISEIDDVQANHIKFHNISFCCDSIEDCEGRVFIRRKKGKWIKIPEFCGDDVSSFIDNHFSCSECKREAEINPWGFYILSDYCPNCGADMKGEQDEY